MLCQMFDGGQESVQVVVGACAPVIRFVDGDESDDVAFSVAQRELAGERPRWGVLREQGGVDFVEKRASITEDEKIVITERLGDDAGEEIEIGFANYVLIAFAMDGFAERAAHVDIA